MMAEERERERERERAEDGGKRRKMAFSGRAGGRPSGERENRPRTDVPQKKQTAATDSMEGISPLRDDGRARCSLGSVLKHTG